MLNIIPGYVCIRVICTLSHKIDSLEIIQIENYSKNSELFFATLSFQHFCVVTADGYWLLHVCSSIRRSVVSERLPPEEFP